jgi:hypothetical protein
MSKNLVIAILVLIFTAGAGFLIVNSSKEYSEPIPLEHPLPPPNNEVINFGSDLMLEVGESMAFEDGLVVSLKEINDSRCKDGVVCIWQGELSSVINVSGGKIKTPAELILGTENHATQTLDGYTFTLMSAKEKSITFVVTYQPPVITSGGCFVGGCSGQLCTDQQDVMSTCEYKEEYACYKSARCERQNTGKCGWTATPALQACLGK